MNIGLLNMLIVISKDHINGDLTVGEMILPWVEVKNEF